MFSILTLDHIVLRSRRPEELAEFYIKALGCVFERRSREFGLIQLRAGDALIDIVDTKGKIGHRFGNPGPGGARNPNVDHFCLRLESFDPQAIRDHLTGFRVRVGEVETRYGADGYGPSVYIEDPEGNTVELKGAPYPDDGKPDVA